MLARSPGAHAWRKAYYADKSRTRVQRVAVIYELGESHVTCTPLGPSPSFLSPSTSSFLLHGTYASVFRFGFELHLATRPPPTKGNLSRRFSCVVFFVGKSVVIVLLFCVFFHLPRASVLELSALRVYIFVNNFSRGSRDRAMT